MYVEFYGLSKDPFSSISSRHIRLSASQRKAIADLHYGLEYGHRVQLLLADAGLGKTTLLLYLEARLKSYAHPFRVSLADSESRENVNRIVGDRLYNTLTTVLSMPAEELATLPASEKKATRPIILLLDDAHALGDADLESILLLAKPGVTENNQVFIVLAGRLELLDKLRRLSSSNSFKETRIAPLDTDEVEEYVKHRLRLAAGENAPIFTPAAMDVIARQSRGVPEGINKLCQAALTAGVKHQLKQIDALDLDADHGQSSGQSISHQPEPLRAVTSSTIVLPRSRSAFGSPLLLTLALVMAATGFWYERTRVVETDGMVVNRNAHLSRASLAEIDHSVGLARERIGKTSAQDSGSINSGKSSAPASLEGSSMRESIVHSPPLLVTRAANLDGSQLGGQGQSPAGASIPTRAIASVVTAATPQAATSPKFTPSVMHDAPLIERPHASTAARDTTTAVDTRRTRVRIDAGDDYMRRGEYSQAIANYEEAMVFSPGDEQLQRRIERARRAKATEAQILWPSSP